MIWLGVAAGLLVVWVLYDVLQRRHAIIRNFPIVGHFRYWLEAVGPELRQYIVTGNDEERPFSRDQRRWVYASAKRQNNYFGFGTDNDLEISPTTIVLRHTTLAAAGGPATTWDPAVSLPTAKVLGQWRGRARAFRPNSLVNVSAMSYGSLSARAVEALNRGAALAGCLHNSGEGGICRYHDRGGELIWQIGTGYFGCRDEHGRFSRERLLEVVDRYPVRALEIKLSQGAKPGLGGVLPAAKVTPEIAEIRGVPLGRDCISPQRHSAFHDVDSLLDFVESVAMDTGLPVGIKSAVGDLGFWRDLAGAMADGSRGVDFVTIDGGEGGTGAAPLSFTDHVAMPFKLGFSEVYRTFAERDLQHRVFFFGSGKLGFPETALFALCLGCDAIQVAREAMLAIGCIQAQRCHTGHCPAGVATQNRWLMRGLDPTLKAARLANYVATLRHELLELARACGVAHPSVVPLECFEIVDDRLGAVCAADHFDYRSGWGLPAETDVSLFSGEAVA